MRPDSQSHARAVISITINGAIFAMSRTKNTVCAVLEYFFLVFFPPFLQYIFPETGCLRESDASILPPGPGLSHFPSVHRVPRLTQHKQHTKF